MIDLVHEAELLERGDAISAADDRERGAVGDRLSDRACPARELVDLGDPHRPVPHDCLRRQDVRGVCGGRVGSDVVAGHAVRDAVHSDDVDRCAWGHRVGDDDVGRKNELVTGLLHEPLHLSDVTGLDQASSDAPVLR